jgi:hypothetical protein
VSSEYAEDGGVVVDDEPYHGPRAQERLGQGDTPSQVAEADSMPGVRPDCDDRRARV